MPQAEFDIIRDYFLQQKISRDDIKLGIGDDAAIVAVPAGQELVIALDTLVAGVHFPEQTCAEDIAYKALAVNLSDLAAMGAEPAWFTLALTLPVSDHTWLTGFARGLFGLAEQYRMQLIGGDTTQGPLTVSIQVAGYVPVGRAMTRQGARIGDQVYVTGTLGEAALGLACLQQREDFAAKQQALDKLNRPPPRIELGLALRELATACIDISDGLLADLGHLLETQKLGARIERHKLPLSAALLALCEQNDRYYTFALAGGDDYELCFSARPDQQAAINSLAVKHAIPITCIGEIEASPGIRLQHNGQAVPLDIPPGYEHFK